MGRKPIPLDTVRSMLRIADCRQSAIRVPTHFRRRPRRASRRSACAPHGGIPFCRTRARTSMPGRSRQDASDVGKKCVSETVRAAESRARVRRTLFAYAEKKTPPDGNPRAFACLGDRGPDLRKRRSGVVEVVAVQQCLPGRPHAFARAARIARRCGKAMVVERGFHCGTLGIHWNSGVFARSGVALHAMGAHVTPVVFDLQTFFSHSPPWPTGGARRRRGWRGGRCDR